MTTTNLTSTKVEFTYEVTDADPVTLPYRAFPVLPTRLVVTVVDGEWKSVKLRGLNAEKDGTPGNMVIAPGLWRGSDFDEGHYGDWNAKDMPGWAWELVGQATRRYADMTNAARVAEGK